MDKKTRVAINGFGRIGRAFFKLAFDRPDLEVVAINDLGDLENLAYLLKYDSIYGPFPFSVEARSEGESKSLIVEGEEVKVFAERDPKSLPWGSLQVDVVVEATGVFRKFEDARQHVIAGAKKVVISAPAKSEPTGPNEATVLMGVNDDVLKTCDVTSNASCTTNSISPVVTILNETIGIEKAILNTIHGYTSTQSLVDSPSKNDFRKGRAAAQNVIPSTTGAAIATTKVIPSLEGKFDGMATRVPVIVGSMADVTFIAKRPTTKEEINDILKKASTEPRWKGIFTVTEDDVVSQDIVGNTHASIADLQFTNVVDGNLVKVLSWYDNEIGYTNALVEHVARTGKALGESVSATSAAPAPQVPKSPSTPVMPAPKPPVPPQAHVPPAPVPPAPVSPQQPPTPPVPPMPTPPAPKPAGMNTPIATKPLGSASAPASPAAMPPVPPKPPVPPQAYVPPAPVPPAPVSPQQPPTPPVPPMPTPPAPKPAGMNTPIATKPAGGNDLGTISI